MRGFYFCNFGALGAFFPFLPLVLAKQGLDATRIALLMSLYPATALVVPPLWGVVSDLMARRILLLRVAVAACGLSLLLLLWQWSIWGLALVIAIFCFFRAPVTSLADAITHARLGEQSRRFASVRVYGSAGFAACVLAMGALNASQHLDWLVLATCGVYLLGAGFTFGLASSPAASDRPKIRDALKHLRSPRTLILLVATACYYAGHATYDAFFSLHLGQLGFGDRFVGLAWMIGVVVEVLVMIVAPRVVEYSAYLLVGCAMVATLRWSLLATLRHPALILLSQPLHGVTFGLWYLCLVKEIQGDAPEPLRAAHQSLGLATMGLGMVIGYLAGGPIFGAGGGALLYRVATTSSGAAILLYFMRSRLARPRR